MKLGNRFCFLFLTYLICNTPSFAEEKILSAPLINLDELKPSYEDDTDTNENLKNNQFILNKKKKLSKSNSASVKLIGLDKITAKTTEILINLGETKKFGPLEIKVLKCSKLDSNKFDNNVAYIQVKDLTENENEKVFIFNGWTFSSDPTIAPFDHAIYDLQLVKCNNV
tara:strand:+ start:1250 stop:1756 length:507 start_codon:yes stop_codon:yes gene_type:complete